MLSSTLKSRNSSFTPEIVAEPRESHRYIVAIGKALMLVLVSILPLEQQVPSIGGFGLLFFYFGLLGVYALVAFRSTLMSLAFHPVFLSMYGLIALGILIESMHQEASYIELARIAQMTIGAVVVAACCADRRLLKSSLLGYPIAGVWLSLMIIGSSYGAISGGDASDFEEASVLREEAFGDAPVKINLNALAFIASQGATVAFAMALTSGRGGRLGYAAVSMLGLFAAFLPLSRSGMIIASVSLFSVLIGHRAQMTRGLILAGLLGLAMWVVVPSSVYSRFTYSTEAVDGKVEGRARVYTAALEYLPEYFIAGVGSGRFWNSWGLGTTFNLRHGVTGAHNCYFQITIYWGIIALLALMFVVWQVYRCVPRVRADEPLTLCLRGLATTLFLVLLVKHNLYDKDFSLGVGILVGAQWALRAGKPKLDFAPSPRQEGIDTSWALTDRRSPFANRRESPAGSSNSRVQQEPRTMSSSPAVD